MISLKFKESGRKVTFDQFGISFDDEANGTPFWLSFAECDEFLPLANFFYHERRQKLYPVEYGLQPAAVTPPKKKRGRPAKKIATAKPGRPRKVRSTTQ